MRSLFHISREAKEIIEEIENLDGELTEELEKALVLNQTELTRKGLNYARAIQGLNYEVETIKKEIDRLSALMKKTAKVSDVLKENLKQAMTIYSVTEIGDDLIKVKIQANPEAVEIVNEAQIPKDFFEEKVTVNLNKTKLKSALKNGEEIEGAVLTKGYRVVIK